ncbi:MAG: phosphatase PAP2 family protein [Bryobacteraceae bacterium]
MQAAEQLVALPQYGVLPSSVRVSKTPPADWRGSREDFESWLETSLASLRELLWPEFGPPGSIAMQRMVALTYADLDLMVEIRSGRLMDAVPFSPVRHLACPPHGEFYQFEDNQKPHSPGELHWNYDRQIDPDQFLKAIPRLFLRGQSRKAPASNVVFFKEQMQRPRPFQAAKLLGYDEFTHEAAITALHPSIISGHCYQGLLGVAGVFEYIFLNEIEMTEDSLLALRQYAVDFGDRRVMAGVHYPSDNIASWLLALDICDRVCHPDVGARVKSELWLAVSHRSEIYGLASLAAEAEPYHPYRPALKELRRRGGEPEPHGPKALGTAAGA